MNKYFSVIALTALVATTAQAQLKITEVQSSENTGAVTHQDWWELTNLGSSAVDISGYKFDDGSANVANSVVLSPSLTINPGESIIFVETMAEADFRTWWGTGLSLSTRIFTYTGSGLGLSSGGDGVNVWDASDTLVASVTFGAATTGTTFGYDPGTGTFGGLSQVGVNGAFSAFENGDIGSPGTIGVVPEPTTYALLGGGLALMALRFRQARR